MKSLGEVIKRPNNLLAAEKLSTALVQVRENPLTEKQLTWINSRLQSLGEKKTPRWKKVRDNYPYGDGFKEVHDGWDFKDPTADEILAVEEANKIAGRVTAKKYLTRLAVHKKMDSDADMMAIVLNDITNAIKDYSEYAIEKVVNMFLEDSSTKFFPSYGEIVDAVKSFDADVKDMMRGVNNNGKM